MRVPVGNHMSKIVIDARLWGVKHTGIGRYTENLVTQLLRVDRRNEYFLLVRQSDRRWIADQLPTARLVVADFPIYSFAEQLFLPRILLGLKPDLYHAPHFNIPIFWFGPSIMTVHDLITHEFRGRRQTTLPAVTYWLKYGVHLGVMRYASVRCRAIIVPSEFIRQKVIETYSTVKQKVYVTYEGVSRVYRKPSTIAHRQQVLRRYNLESPYLIYTGNTYEHKNLLRLIEAVKIVKLPLVVVCARSIFRQRFETEVSHAGALESVRFIGDTPDEDVRDLYREALAFVTPSLSEGFGLAGVEAMAAGTIILSSAWSCLPEIYGDVPLYFDPLSVDRIAEAIRLCRQLTRSQRQDRVRQGKLQSERYRWEETARKTLAAYNYALNGG
jgi:glycosyltransferase involved in cell wall biosynthesis